MSDPFLSEIRLMSFGFPPKNWALCNGQLMPINQNPALFSLLGTTYGGDGRVDFGLPDLQGRTPIHRGNSHTLGERGGEQNHTLTSGELPSHTHPLRAADTPATSAAATGSSVLAQAPGYTSVGTQLVALAPASLDAVGGGQAHLNLQPFLTLNFCIALQGVFPSRS